MRIYSILFLVISMLFGCNKGTPTESAKVVPEAQKNGGLKVMTNDDMEKMQQERKEMINRPTPLGEEKDAVEALRKQAPEK